MRTPACSGQVEERERGKSREREKGITLVGRKRQGARGRESREGEMELSQGLVRNLEKLQGSFCKVKFSIDLKP
jgi:hypothetical protein